MQRFHPAIAHLLGAVKLVVWYPSLLQRRTNIRLTTSNLALAARSHAVSFFFWLSKRNRLENFAIEIGMAELLLQATQPRLFWQCARTNNVLLEFLCGNKAKLAKYFHGSRHQTEATSPLGSSTLRTGPFPTALTCLVSDTLL